MIVDIYIDNSFYVTKEMSSIPRTGDWVVLDHVMYSTEKVVWDINLSRVRLYIR